MSLQAIALSLAVLAPAAAQQLAEGSFDSMSSPDAWSIVSPSYSNRAYSTDDAQGEAPASGSMETFNSASVAYGTAQFRQCLTGVTIGVLYLLRVSIKLPTQASSGWASGTLTYYDNATCNGASLGVAGVSPVASSTPDSWITTESSALEAPPGALSMDVRLFSTKVESSGTLSVLFDDASIQQLVFADGFESGDVLSWSSSTPP